MTLPSTKGFNVSCIISQFRTLNQYSAQNFSLNIYNITLNIATRFDPQETIIRESDKATEHKTKLIILV